VLEWFGRSVHAAADAAVPQHSRGRLLDGHRQFEGLVRDMWNTRLPVSRHERDAWVERHATGSEVSVEEVLACTDDTRGLDRTTCEIGITSETPEGRRRQTRFEPVSLSDRDCMHARMLAETPVGLVDNCITQIVTRTAYRGNRNEDLLSESIARDVWQGGREGATAREAVHRAINTAIAADVATLTAGMRSLHHHAAGASLLAQVLMALVDPETALGVPDFADVPRFGPLFTPRLVNYPYPESAHPIAADLRDTDAPEYAFVHDRSCLEGMWLDFSERTQGQSRLYLYLLRSTPAGELDLYPTPVELLVAHAPSRGIAPIVLDALPGKVVHIPPVVHLADYEPPSGVLLQVLPPAEGDPLDGDAFGFRVVRMGCLRETPDLLLAPTPDCSWDWQTGEWTDVETDADGVVTACGRW
jgi:hypothetical protein